MYILDMNNTKGHVATINDGKWHPRDENKYMTGSNDGTIRHWDTKGKIVGISGEVGQSTLIKVKDQRGMKLAVGSVCYATQGDLIAAGCANGAVQFWDLRQ